MSRPKRGLGRTKVVPQMEQEAQFEARSQNYFRNCRSCSIALVKTRREHLGPGEEQEGGAFIGTAKHVIMLGTLWTPINSESLRERCREQEASLPFRGKRIVPLFNQSTDGQS